jgi:hypothetical protein
MAGQYAKETRSYQPRKGENSKKLLAISGPTFTLRPEQLARIRPSHGEIGRRVGL